VAISWPVRLKGEVPVELRAVRTLLRAEALRAALRMHSVSFDIAERAGVYSGRLYSHRAGVIHALSKPNHSCQTLRAPYEVRHQCFVSATSFLA
jgi:hypothetical protein